MRTLAALSFPPPCCCFGGIFWQEPHEAHVSTEQSAPSTHPWVPCTHGHQGRSSHPGPPARQGSQASLRVTAAPRGAPSAIDLPAPLRFTSTQRLHSKAEFDSVYRNSRRSADALFAVHTRPNDSGHARLGLSVSARTVGGAVRRNRVKRLVRESFRLHQLLLPAVDIVINSRPGARAAPNAAIMRSLEHHWRTVVKQCASH